MSMAGSAAAGGAQGSDPSVPPVVVKKYANRRLYNTEASTYVTLDDLAKMVRNGRDFVVYDAKSGDDITRSVLTQIIVEEESKGGQNLLPTAFLRQLIGYYGDNLQGLVPRYLEFAMASFGRQQDQMRRTMEHTMGGFMPFPNIDELGKQNMAMMERAMSLFVPFGRREDAPAEVDALKAELDMLRRELASIKDTKSRP
ncbi:polyhydroxyalkanoate synthesis repressor PhaR [Roseomonas sp. CAU 1739]|uniref:polyhydroxyalkanoate synthesis repressor PhaR n=1 Tax=Roseomonas sp. CAU 1739 TaxID=3140364 RepID=UPI00325A59CA